MWKQEPIFTRATFQFFRDLARNNKNVWMDANRERYQEFVVKPFRRLLEDVSPAVLQLDARFDTSARGGRNFSRINRDIRFAKDKTPYRPQMYLKFPATFSGEGETGELYVGLSAKAVTAGFRVYGGSKRKDSCLAQTADARVAARPEWVEQQKKRLARRYESYWYMAQKGQWKEQSGWPVDAEEWKKLQGWIVRRKLKLAQATRAAFPKDIAKIFGELYPILRFTSLQD